MKKIKIITVILLTIFITIKSFAQEAAKDLNEIRLTYGAASLEQYAIIISSAVSGTIGGLFLENISKIDGNFIGPVMIQYTRSFKNNNFTVGGLLAYSNAKTEVFYESKPDAAFHFNITYFTLMGQSEFKYYNGKNFQFYSGLDFGVDIIAPSGTDSKGNSTPTKISPTGHVTAAGFKFGAEKFGGNIELGFGAKGVFNAGFYTRL